MSLHHECLVGIGGYRTFFFIQNTNERFSSKTWDMHSLVALEILSVQVFGSKQKSFSVARNVDKSLLKGIELRMELHRTSFKKYIMNVCRQLTVYFHAQGSFKINYNHKLFWRNDIIKSFFRLIHHNIFLSFRKCIGRFGSMKPSGPFNWFLQ